MEDAVEKLGFGTFQIVLTVFSGLVWVSESVAITSTCTVPGVLIMTYD